MYDVIVIGGGPAGITASIYIKRAGFNVIVFNNSNDLDNKNYQIENYYGIKSIPAKELQEKGIEQVKAIGVEVIEKEVVALKYSMTEANKYEVVTSNQGIDEKYEASFIVIATGTSRKKPEIKGLKEFEGRGVSYCAICDAPLYKNKNVAVLGEGDFAIEEIDELLPLVSSVKMFTNGKEPILNRDGVEVESSVIREIRGSNKVEEVEFETGKIEKIDGLFVAQGVATSLDLAKQLGVKTEENSIIVDDNKETNVNNVYACGDCIGGEMQIVKASYDGMKVGLNIIRKLRNN